VSGDLFAGGEPDVGKSPNILDQPPKHIQPSRTLKLGMEGEDEEAAPRASCKSRSCGVTAKRANRDGADGAPGHRISPGPGTGGRPPGRYPGVRVGASAAIPGL